MAKQSYTPAQMQRYINKLEKENLALNRKKKAAEQDAEERLEEITLLKRSNETVLRDNKQIAHSETHVRKCNDELKEDLARVSKESSRFYNQRQLWIGLTAFFAVASLAILIHDLIR